MKALAHNCRRGPSRPGNKLDDEPATGKHSGAFRFRLVRGLARAWPGRRPDYRRSYCAFPLDVDRSLGISPGAIGSGARSSTESARTRTCRSAMAAMDHATRKGQPYPGKRMSPGLSWKWVWAKG